MIGRAFGHYEIIEPLGKGGMGEVYRARDTNLERDVAIKLLPDELAQDPERLSRFEREAKLLASLNHPHIATIFGLERANGDRFIVLELVEGETLAQRLEKGAVPVPQALELSRQIAEALEAAHEAGIIHRDLKPSNVVVTPAGKAKVLDFGIAKTIPTARAEKTDVGTELTSAGTMVGTAPYMSPEQVRGEAIDKRADIWALGCVLFELLTGHQAFGRASAAEILAAILEQDPDWTRLPAATSPAIRLLLKRCLRKDATRRLHAVADARIEIEESSEEGERDVTVATKEPAPALSRQLLLASILIVAGVVAGALGAGLFTPPEPPTEAFIYHLLIDLPPGQRLWGGHALEVEPDAGGPQRPSRTAFAFSPDGQQLVYAAIDEDGPRLYLRPLDEDRATPLRGTEGACCPFFSPDGQWVGFFARDPDETLTPEEVISQPATLKTVPLTGGEPRTILVETGGWGVGASWSTDHTIVLPGQGGLVRVPDGGGSPQPLATSDQSGEERHIFALPGGEAVLLTVRRGIFNWDEAEIAVQPLGGGDRRVLITDGAEPRFVAPGYLVFVRQGTLMAVRFDPLSLELRGDPVQVRDDVMQAAWGPHAQLDTGSAQVALSSTGSLAYVPGSTYPAGSSSLAWVGRGGETEPLGLPVREYWGPRVSADGRYLVYAASTLSQRDDIWLYDVERADENRLTFDESGSTWPVWSPDRSQIAFTVFPKSRVFWKEIASSAQPQLLELGRGLYLSDWSSHGVLALVTPEVHPEIWVFSLEGGGEPQRFFELSAGFGARWPTFSPDGKWLAYASNLTDRWEIYVRPYPGPDPAIKVSSEGGRSPAWSKDGSELFYRNGDKMMVVDVVDVRDGAPFAFENRRQLFERPFQPAEPVRSYDVGRDGRFLMVTPIERQPEPVTRIHVILYWVEELKERLPLDGS